MIGKILDIDSFDQKCDILKGLLHSERLKKHMVIIGVDQSLSNSYLYEHRYLENIKILCKSAGKCDDQHQYKAIIEASMVYTPEGFTKNSKMSYRPPVPTK